MVFDDWTLIGKMGGEPLFGENPMRPDMDSVFGLPGIGGGHSILDHPAADFDSAWSAPGRDYGPFGIDEPVTGAFLISDAAVSIDAQPSSAQGPSFVMSYSMRMLLDMTSGWSSFSRAAAWR